MSSASVPPPGAAARFGSFLWARRRLIGGLALEAFGLAVAVLLAVLSSGEQAMTAGEAGLLVLVGFALQLGGGLLIGGRRATSPAHARSAVRNLIAIGQKANVEEGVVTTALEGGQVRELRAALQRASIALSDIVRGVEDAIQDWREVHDHDIQEVLEGDDDGSR